MSPPRARGGFRGGVRPESADVTDRWHVAYPISFPVVVGLSSVSVLAEPDEYRNLLQFRNPSATANIYLEYGRAATTNSILRLAPGAMVVLDAVVPQSEIFAISDTAGAVLALAHSVYTG